MPPPETSARYQTALLWEVTRVDEHNQPRVRPPREIAVRWNWTRTYMRDKDGTPVAVDAVIVTDEDLPRGSLLWLGTEEEWYGTGSGGVVDDLVEVKLTKSTLDLRGRVARKTAGASRYKGSVPELG
jgi:hypothetical protein